MTEVNVAVVKIFRDGNRICALVGDNLASGVAGFGKTLPEALKALAKAYEADGIKDDL